jgi:hypothetical protein
VLQFQVEIPTSLKAALDAETIRSGRSPSSIITRALAQYLEKPIHTVFQVSTSGALVAGVFDREVTVQTVLEHGDFGLGTFANLDGEMVFDQVLGLGRGRHALRRADEQIILKRLAKPGERVAERRLGHVQARGRLGHAAVLHHGVEHDEQIEIQRAQIHATSVLEGGERLRTASTPAIMLNRQFAVPSIHWQARGCRSILSAMAIGGHGMHWRKTNVGWISERAAETPADLLVAILPDQDSPPAALFDVATAWAQAFPLSGVSDLTTGLATANSEGDPSVAIGGAVATDEALKQIHQTMDAVSLLKPVTKYSVTVGAPTQVSEVMANAFRTAESGRPGGAYVNLPKDVMTAPCAHAPLAAYWLRGGESGNEERDDGDRAGMG